MDKESPDGLIEETDAALAESEALIREYHGAADGRIRYAVTPRFAVTCTRRVSAAAASWPTDTTG